MTADPDPTNVLQDISILLVDDDDDSREVFAEALHLRGAKPLQACRTSEALEKLATDHPDILLSDIGMPDEDGYSLMRRVRSLSAADGGNIPAAALTAYSRPIDRQRALDAGFQFCLTKPITLANLLTVAVDLVRMKTRSAAAKR
ncbi:MAG TPA: response regulator [Polyangiaceae bacterium]|jgi:hypothetical protein|nr:response regulator [Polyangiaceae bacterium]